MPNVSQSPSSPHAGPSRLTLNTDGKPHPVENTLTVITFVVGVVAFFIGLVVSLHMFAAILGIVGCLVGMYAQMVSVTTAQRAFIVTGIIAAFVGAGLGLGHGGFGY